MGLWERLARWFRRRHADDRAGDPRDVLDSSYERQLEMLARVRRSVADVATSRRRLDLQVNELRAAADRLYSQAAQAVDENRDEVAQAALTRRGAALGELRDITAQRDALRAEEEELDATAARLQARVEMFRTRKDTIKASYTAAEAQNRINEAVSGISRELGDVGLAMERAEDKVIEMQARASALDDLLSSGVLQDARVPVGGGDRPPPALERARAEMDAQAELAALKTRKSLGAAPEDPRAPTQARAPGQGRTRAQTQAQAGPGGAEEDA